LQFNNNPGPILSVGTGHAFSSPDPIFGVTQKGDAVTGLVAQPGTTLAFIGGDISLTGGYFVGTGRTYRIRQCWGGDLSVFLLPRWGGILIIRKCPTFGIFGSRNWRRRILLVTGGGFAGTARPEHFCDRGFSDF
jgi:hypothetical protein